MYLRSGKRKKHYTPKKKQKNQKNNTLHHAPHESTSLEFLNSSDSLCSFNMDDPEGAYSAIDSLLGVPSTSNTENPALSSIWTNANSNRMTFENHIRNIVGVPLHQERMSLPPNLSVPPVTSNNVTTAPPTILTTSVASSHSHDTSYAHAPYRHTGFPPLIPVAPSTTDVLLSTLIRKLDAGFANLTATYNARPNHPTEPFQPQNVFPNTRPLQPQSVPLPQQRSQAPTSDDTITRLENLIGSLATQVKSLSDKVDGLSRHGPSPSPPSVPATNADHQNSAQSQERFNGPRLPVPLYKTWPDKWRVKYDGDNQKLPIEFFFDQLTSLRELNDVMWDQVISALPLILEGEALKWFHRYKKDEEELHWPKLKRDMISHFRGTESEDSILFKITNRKQANQETFDQFYHSILDLKDRLIHEKMSDERMMGILYNNAKFEIKTAMVSAGPTSLRNFVNKCRAIDKLYYPGLYKEYPATSKRVSEIDSGPATVLEPQFNVEAFTGRRPNQPQSTANMKCWNCGNIGHSWHMCDEPRQIFCYWCGYKNATCKNCPRCSTNFHSGHNLDPTPPDPSAHTMERP